MKEETEQKSLPASHKKLRDARRKGQVSHSRDFVAGFTLTILFAYLLFALPVLGNHLEKFVDFVSLSVDRPFAEASSRDIKLAIEIFMLASLPIVVAIVATDLIAGMAATFGPVFSFEPVKPKFDHINPAQGLKRIASLRNVVEFAKTLIKVVILAGAFWFVLRDAIQALFEMPSCGKTCLAEMAIATLKPLAATAAAAFVAIGLLDLLVQRRLFLRDMRMTRTESKREVKDLEGDPLIRGERRRMRRQLTTRPARLGLREAVIAVFHHDRIVGLRYRPGETPIPVVVCKGSGAAGTAMLAEARQLGVPTVDNDALVAALAARHAIGDTVIPDLFKPVAETLIAAGFS
jgi:type III secretion protein U